MDWFPWHYERYRLKTRHLTAEQDGIYRRLIDEYMETRQPLPNDDLALSGIARVDLACFSSASSIVRAFFYVKKKGFLNHKTCDEMLDDQDSLSTFRSERAKKAAFARHNKPNKIKTKPATSKPIALLGDATITVNNNSKQLSKDNNIKFEEFWALYPRKDGKAKVQTAYPKYLLKTSQEQIITGLEKYVNHIRKQNTELKYVKQPYTWLNGGHWEDQYDLAIKPSKPEFDVVKEFGFEF